MDNIFDTIIIGSGPAGISCAIYLKRYNLNPLVITTKESSLNKALIDNYYGFKSIKGIDLWQNGINQALELGIEIKYECVTSIEFDNPFTIKTNLNKYKAKTVFIATGLSRKKINVPNLDKLLGSGISQCATCDGFFFKNKKLGIIGSSSFMEEELSVLERFSNDITIFTDGHEYQSESHEVITDEIVSFDGDDKLKGINTINNFYPLDGVFLALGNANGLDFANHLGLKVINNSLWVDDNYMTNIKGIFAGGDAIGGLLQVSKAVSDGALAALKIKNYLK